ncbi:MAG: hybrid-cluster NAD(P)-dependent oxidoreductase [Brevibacterium sp.]|uniref:hybrid-cluster NAD(P)-dependent oxidoreductase n=1 Tax=Brevibacterium sp. TaxID=1701 RepID=UPI00264A401B|nr:hybrid-cluster NAD(P)-dependent oxidoreductase [Brevibacterium sp.]MDN5909919.1 hybrid-cluster NAD(P)-dependent oxidoreductase [Brevibacterium sp.]MDN6135433.1 hybrid-cluster NAD(P)-dependent oxidoreductase [Brevibacterium sp.]MDN6158429.1 hybrid-cluster NAD(P)-dependent oxidoreductase [Brevibacterium sp.]MDN6176404.1 hybrid-cluster NAD(P)-dependent oxidoreductase [Brevibacterium sp.]MDN6188488.1 hybrid-cluster NAD(P)-dependent oxidoreductase [Brevibacterium sp.]
MTIDQETLHAGFDTSAVGINTAAVGLDSAAPGLGAAAPDVDAELTGMVECVAITEVTHNVKSFELFAPWMARIDFEPGQYVTVRIPELELERCYSIASAPFGTNTFTLTIKRVDSGAVSTYLHDVLGVGDRIHVDGPYGLFSTSFHPAAKHLFVSGGSGISPIMSMVRSLLARPAGTATDIVLIHNAATPADIIFRPELEQLAEVPGVSVVTMCSRDSASEVEVAEEWTGRRGRITSQTLAEVVPELRDRETFVCGPGDYMAAVRLMLDERGVLGSRVHEESFVFATSPAQRLARKGLADDESDASAIGGSAPDCAGSAGQSFAIDFTVSGKHIACDPATTVLDAAAEAGMAFPSSCEEGMCGTCKSVLVSGEVEMNHAGGIRPKEIAAGKFLPCCSTPLSDLVVER